MSPSVFDPGLEYTAVAETALSDVDAGGDLVVRGYPVEDLAAAATYEEALFLLLRDRLPTADERADLRADLAGRRGVGPGVAAVLDRAVAADWAPMAALRAGLAAVDAPEGPPRETARRVVAAVPTVAAAYGRRLQGAEPVGPREDLGHAANYLHALTGEAPDEAAVRALETLLVTLVDHGLNPSTFAARVVASTGADLASATTAAVGALKGPRHGGRLGPVFELFEAVRAADDAEAAVREHVGEDGAVPGFGHRVYEVRDPRAAVLSAATARYAEESDDGGTLATARELEAAGTAVLADRGATPVPTVEFYVVALLSALAVPPALATPTFAVARAGGWVAHAIEQRADGRLLRPTSRYVGATDRTWTPVEAREGDGSVLGDAPSLEPVSDRLAALSDPTRLELLLVLADGDAPVAYSTLLAASSVEDKGRLNYHLRRLRGDLVADGEDGYRLTETGRRLVDALVTGDDLAGDGGD